MIKFLVTFMVAIPITNFFPVSFLLSHMVTLVSMFHRFDIFSLLVTLWDVEPESTINVSLLHFLLDPLSINVLLRIKYSGMFVAYFLDFSS